MANIVVSDAHELYEFANHLRWAADDLIECYQKLEKHTADMLSHWSDSSAERFMQVLEQEEKVICEIEHEFERFETVVRKRANMVQEYVDCGKRFNF